MSPKQIDTMDPIVKRLRAVEHASPDLRDAARMYAAVLPLIRDADLRVAPVPLTADEIRMKMASGVPLLSGIDLELDVQAAVGLMLQLVRALENCGEITSDRMSWLPWKRTPEPALTEAPDCRGLANGAATRQIRQALESGRLNVGDLLTFIAAGDSESAAALAQSLQLDSGLVEVLAGYTLKPALHAWRRQLASHAEGIRWDKGSCFICGAAASMAELQDNDQVKHLRCGRCGADWLFRRLLCVQCGNENYETLRFLYIDDRQENSRVEVCDSCSSYLKVIASYEPTPPEMLAVADLATLHLDYIAQERGYVRCTAGSAP